MKNNIISFSLAVILLAGCMASFGGCAGAPSAKTIFLTTPGYYSDLAGVLARPLIGLRPCDLQFDISVHQSMSFSHTLSVINASGFGLEDSLNGAIFSFAGGYDGAGGMIGRAGLLNFIGRAYFTDIMFDITGLSVYLDGVFDGGYYISADTLRAVADAFGIDTADISGGFNRSTLAELADFIPARCFTTGKFFAERVGGGTYLDATTLNLNKDDVVSIVNALLSRAGDKLSAEALDSLDPSAIPDDFQLTWSRPMLGGRVVIDSVTVFAGGALLLEYESGYTISDGIGSGYLRASFPNGEGEMTEVSINIKDSPSSSAITAAYGAYSLTVDSEYTSGGSTSIYSLGIMGFSFPLLTTTSEIKANTSEKFEAIYNFSASLPGLIALLLGVDDMALDGDYTIELIYHPVDNITVPPEQKENAVDLNKLLSKFEELVQNFKSGDFDFSAILEKFGK